MKELASLSGEILAYENGQTAYSGAYLDAFSNLDQFFVNLAKKQSAKEYLFPSFLPVKELAKIDYFVSFPHLANFPVSLKDEGDNIKNFVATGSTGCEGHLSLTETTAIENILTPAACYHFYVALKGKSYSEPQYYTTRNTCYRREKYYRSLERQWCFSMREIVCIGTEQEVLQFLDFYRNIMLKLFDAISLPIKLEHATDPFFQPLQDPKFIAQKLSPVKHEMIYKDSLAIGSLNFHRNYFGEAFEINAQEEPAFSGCVAFGIDRWMFACLEQFGPDQSKWPKWSALGL